MVHKGFWKDYYIGRMTQYNERSSKFFFDRGLCVPGSISMLHNEKEELVHDDKSILKTCSQFYEKLFCDSEILENDDAPTDDSCNEQMSQDKPYCFLPDEMSLRLSTEEKKMLDSDISLNDLRESVMRMKTGKASGLDGLPVEFYQEFFDVVGEALYNSFVFSFNQGELSISQKRGVVKLIPKKD